MRRPEILPNYLRCSMTSGSVRRCRLPKGHLGLHVMIWDEYWEDETNE